jgi:hypothetical protein
MLCRGSFIFAARAFLLSMALMVCPHSIFAQAGPGGGHMGGGAVGGGLSSGGGGVGGGIDVKDDLKGFHTLLAVQATSHQVTQYSLMLKSTEAARAEMGALLDEISKQKDHSQFAAQGATTEQAIEKARTDAKNYLESFSEAQRNGLREVSKKLLKEEADLGQEAGTLAAELSDAKATVQLLSNAAQNLDQTLANLRRREVELGDDMSISVEDQAESNFALEATKNSIQFVGQPVVIVTSGAISGGKAENGRNPFTLELSEDLSDLQQNITGVLRWQLNKSERCGEHLEVQDATLTPLAPASLATLQLHYERWTCLGRENMNEMAEGNGTMEVKLTPSLDNDGGLRFRAQINRVDAPGLLGELLRSGSLGDELREKVAEVLLAAAQRGSDLEAILPAAAQGHAELTRAQFEGTGMGRLTMVMTGEINLSGEDAKLLLGELRRKSSSPAAAQAMPR